MNLTKCKNGHYYDADKYPSCPHCGKNGGGNDDATISMDGPSFKPSGTPSSSGMPGMGGGMPNMGGMANMGGGMPNMGGMANMGGGMPNMGGMPGMGGMAPQQVDKTVSLFDAVNVASNPSSVMPNVAGDNDKTISYYGGSLGKEPVVGWLVCVEGELLGKAFELKNGKNFIGRSPSMDIVLQGDPNVSRDRHAIVTYEPKGRVFFAQPGESSELFYVDGQVVLMNVELHDRNVLEVGNTKLMFVPFCGPDFSWDDVAAKR